MAKPTFSTPRPKGRGVGPFMVGYVYPRSGTAGIYGPSCETCAELAVEKINREGGIRGREVELFPIDGGHSEPDRVAAEVGRLVRHNAIDAVSGWHISAVRAAIAETVRGRVPYVYAALHEGGAINPDILYAGEDPAMQIGPALGWLRNELGLHRWMIVGNDYIWPTTTARYVRSLAREQGLTIQSEHYAPLCTQDYSAIVELVAAEPPDGVLMLLVGQDAVAFNRAFRRSGLHSEVARFSPIVDENVLLAAEPDGNEGMFVSAGYFDSLMTTAALDFADSYHARFGSGFAVPRLNSIGESCYEALLLLREVLRRPRSDHQLAYESPRGDITLSSNQIRQDVYLAAASGYDFDVICRLPSPTLG
ncbi:hypothetical protein B1790_29985 [Mycobacterium sp. AT1]|nr:hypothetical protein B1790_29985 [Mycobacterium sp. AT1]